MPTTIENVMTPIGATGPITSPASPLMGKINRYNASAGPITVSLPALSSCNVGGRVAIEKDVLDTSSYNVTVTCIGADTFDNGGTSEAMKVAGQLRTLQVVQIGSTRYWKIIDGNTPLGQLDSRYAAKSSLPFVNVKDYGVKGDGTTDDTSAINACIAGSATGSTIFFPAGTYLISAPIVLLPSRSYVGAGHAHADTTIIKQKNSANITNAAGLAGLLVANAWSTNAATCDLPIRIENLTIDGNKANNASSTACGIVLTNYRSWVVDCDILNAPKDGVRLTDTTANGTNHVSNTCVENRVVGCHIDSSGGDGVRGVSGNGNSNTDGYLIGCIISNCTGSGINMDRGAGWHIRDNHLYTIAVHGINAAAAFGTFITNNYIEDFGGQATAAAYYAGIALVQLTGRQSLVTGNYVGCNEPSGSVGGYQYISISSAFGSTDSHIVVTGNVTHGPVSPTSKGIAFVYAGNGGGSTSVIYDDNNDVDNINSALYNDGTATVRSVNVTNATGTLTASHGGTGATTLTGLVKGNGTGAMTAAAAGTDYTSPSSTETQSNKTIPATGNKVAGGLASLTSEISISNSTTETTILTTTLTTGELVVGSTYRIRVHNTVLNLVSSNNLTIKVYLGGVAATATFAWAGAITAGGVWNEFLITIRSVGATGTFMCNGVGMGTGSGSTATTATNTVDTTQANPILKVTAQFSAASASNNVKIENAIIERVM